MIFNKFFITFTIGLSIFTTTLQASQSCLLSYSQSQLSFKSSFSISTTLSSHRKMKTVFQQGRQFKSKKEIIVVLHGLGKSSSDLKYFMQEAEKKDDSVLAIDLHGFGETAVLNNNYKSETSIPYEYSRDDVFEILKQIPLNH